MAFQKISNVTINSKNSFAGGFIYSVNFTAGLRDSPSRIVISLVSESGDFLEPELSLERPYTIKIGNSFQQNYYLISREIEKGSNGRQMQVTFVDSSVRLDQIWVGLYKKAGNEDTSIKGLIILGQSMLPCDQDLSGAVDQTDINTLLLNSTDPCEIRCSNESIHLEPIAQKCIEKEVTQIFETKYNFSQLLDALEGKGGITTSDRPIVVPALDDNGQVSLVTYFLPPIQTNKNTNPFNRIKINNRPREINLQYFKDFTGKLRDVLRNWCAEFGYTFVWENDGITFIDTKTRPQVDLTPFANLESTKDIKTLEGTIARGVISHYAEPGILAQRECPVARPLFLRCLTLKDLFGNNNKNDPAYYLPVWKPDALIQNTLSDVANSEVNPPIIDPQNYSPNNQLEYKDDIFTNGVPIENFEISCVCAYYGTSFRNFYNFYGYYGITDAKSALSYQGKWLDRLGQIKILDVYWKNSPDETSKSIYNDILLGKLVNSNLNISQDIRDIWATNEAYFMVVQRPFRPIEQTEDLLEKQFRIEENLANNFLGKHWYRSFNAEFFGPNPQIKPAGSYHAGLSVNAFDLPFTHFYHTYKSTVSKMTSSFVQKHSNNYRRFGADIYLGDIKENISNKIVRSLVYFQKQTENVWQPTKQGSTELKGTLESIERLQFKKIPLTTVSDADFNSLKSFGPPNAKITHTEIDNQTLELWVCYPFQLGQNDGGQGVQISSQFITNKNEENPQHEQGLGPYELATVGLTSKSCIKYTIDNLNITIPAGASVLYNNDQTFKWQASDVSELELSKTEGISDPLYKVYLMSSTPNRGIIGKTESVLIKPADPTNTLSVDYLTNEIDRSALQLLNILNNSCEIPPEIIAQLHESYIKSLNFNSDKPFRSISYRIFGTDVGKQLKISEGLENFNISISAEGAVITEFTISDRVFTPPSQDFLLKKFEIESRKNYTLYRPNPL